MKYVRALAELGGEVSLRVHPLEDLIPKPSEEELLPVSLPPPRRTTASEAPRAKLRDGVLELGAARPSLLPAAPEDVGPARMIEYTPKAPRTLSTRPARRRDGTFWSTAPSRSLPHAPGDRTYVVLLVTLAAAFVLFLAIRG
jgi:hypothetical protein